MAIKPQTKDQMSLSYALGKCNGQFGQFGLFGNGHRALLRGTALQTGLPASSCSHMARIKMADKPAPIRQSCSTFSETIICESRQIKMFFYTFLFVFVCIFVFIFLYILYFFFAILALNLVTISIILGLNK